MLQDKGLIIPEVARQVGAYHFFVPAHLKIYQAILDHKEQVDALNFVALTQYLIEVGQLQLVGGPAYITELGTMVPTSANWQYYVDTVRDKYLARLIINASEESIRAAQDDTIDTKELVASHERRMEAIRVAAEVGHMRLPNLCDMSQHLGDNLPPEPPEIVSHVLHQGSKIVVGGTSKCRKTMALIDLAVSVATGTAWWGFDCVKGPVCYINFEIQDAFFAKRVNAVCTAKRVKLEAGMLVAWNLRGHGGGIENLVEDLLAVLRHRKFVLVIIDPIYKALGDRDENKAGDVASMLNQLEKIAVKTQAAVAFGAHYSKGNQALKESIDRIGGSGVFARDPDSILTMTAHEEEECFTVEATLRNFAPREPFVVKWEWPLFTWADDLDPRALKRPRGPKEKHSPDLLLDQLSVVQGAKPKEVIKYLDEQHGVSRKTVYRMKERLEAKKLMIVKEGCWWRAGGA